MIDLLTHRSVVWTANGRRTAIGQFRDGSQSQRTHTDSHKQPTALSCTVLPHYTYHCRPCPVLGASPAAVQSTAGTVQENADARKANADDLLSEIDTDGDGEISRQEFSDHLFGTVRGVAVVDE